MKKKQKAKSKIEILRLILPWELIDYTKKLEKLEIEIEEI